MKIQRALHQYSVVELLLCLDANSSPYSLEEIQTELKSRELTQESMKEGLRKIEYIKEQRSLKASESLSLALKIMYIVMPTSARGIIDLSQTDNLQEYQEFIDQSGYNKKAQQIKFYQKIGLAFWGIIFLTTISIIYLKSK